ncbi:MAG: hypothetical protein SVY15_03535 [Halobacteriota archaeon]|nr:hypothetical protein [Halobacteriota archaeon]
MISDGELLYYLFEAKGVTVESASEWYGTDKQDAEMMLEKFYEEGFAKKEEKRKGVLYTITERGLKELGYYVI